MILNRSANKVVGPRIAEHNDDLELRLSQIGKIFDIPRLIDEPTLKPQIANLYVNFKKFSFMYPPNSAIKEGFYHFGISYDGKHKKEDFKEHAKIVEKYIHDSNAKNVLELAYGVGATSAFLAKRNPDVTFDGVDLSNKPLKRYTKIPNAHFQIGDFHDLRAFKDDAYDIVFGIVALCYSNNKLQVLREVKKKLRRGGLFIVIDGYRRDRTTPLSSSEQMLLKLIEASWVIDKFECVKDVEGYMQEEYSIAETADLTQNILPMVTAEARLLRNYFAHPMFARVVAKLLPPVLVKAPIAPFLLPISMKRQIACYYLHVLKNDK